MKTNILILAAGHAGFETHDGGYPLCLTEMEGTSLIERIVHNTRNIKNAKYTFALREEDVEHFHLDNVAELLAPGSTVIRVSNDSRGSACTALLAASQFDANHEVLVVSANELVDVDLAEVVEAFRARELDAGALTFQSVHPRYSYVRLNAEGLVTEAAQQKPISNHATAGVFWYAKGGAFIEAIKNMIRKDASVKGNFYIAPTFNEIILNQGRAGVQFLDIKKYYPLKTERQMYQFENGGAA
jgi:bifunctional N-acetylglucosamine-1-phosphate-uridyltransferase/glucosamine-1-phosphate-acetyltransferase GlmU-like protein